MKISIIVAVHNRLNYTQRCLNSIYKSQTKHELETILVDDGSTDGTSDWVIKNMPDVTILKGDGSLWFGGAMQKGIDFALLQNKPADFILTLNNDTYPKSDAIEKMVFTSSQNDSVVASTYYVEETREIQTCGFVWNFMHGLVSPISKLDSTSSSTSHTVEVDAVATTATLYPTKLLRTANPVSLRLHPHHRYDAVLSSNLRDAGAQFQLITEILFNHNYGNTNRYISVKKTGMLEFYSTRLKDPLSVTFIPGVLHLEFVSAPNKMLGCFRALRVVFINFVQLFMIIFYCTLRFAEKKFFKNEPEKDNNHHTS